MYVSIDHALSVSMCSCKQLLIILVTAYVHWQHRIYIEKAEAKKDVHADKNMKILLVNLAFLWPTNQNTGLKRLCLCNCKQSSCHTQRLSNSKYYTRKIKKQDADTCMKLSAFGFTLANPAPTESSSPSSTETLPSSSCDAKKFTEPLLLHKTSKKQDDTSDS